MRVVVCALVSLGRVWPPVSLLFPCSLIRWFLCRAIVIRTFVDGLCTSFWCFVVVRLCNCVFFFLGFVFLRLVALFQGAWIFFVVTVGLFVFRVFFRVFGVFCSLLFLCTPVLLLLFRSSRYASFPVPAFLLACWFVAALLSSPLFLALSEFGSAAPVFIGIGSFFVFSVFSSFSFLFIATIVRRPSCCFGAALPFPLVVFPPRVVAFSLFAVLPSGVSFCTFFCCSPVCGRHRRLLFLFCGFAFVHSSCSLGLVCPLLVWLYSDTPFSFFARCFVRAGLVSCPAPLSRRFPSLLVPPFAFSAVVPGLCVGFSLVLVSLHFASPALRSFWLGSRESVAGLVPASSMEALFLFCAPCLFCLRFGLPWRPCYPLP